MNSLLSGFSNVLKNSSMAPMQQAATSQTPNILMQAMGAALRGESPQEFMQNLARSHPQLRQYDLTNLQQAAQQVCQQNGADMQAIAGQLDNMTNNIMQSPR